LVESETRERSLLSAEAAPGEDWWRGAIIYQIYPRSFLDTSGNGVGDLAGITRKLDYVAGLGVDAIWISPFVASPMLDFGYDVSDYLTIDPLFGTMEDFEALIEQAHARGLKVLMDQVLSHTSDRHAWFLESREGRDNAKADWYVWADAKPDGAPPNNWLSVFGGSSWQWEPRRSQYYLHNFLRQQPDLNFHAPAVQDALLDVCRYWLDRGVDGFRLDVCAFYFHDASLRDNPPNPTRPKGSHFMFNPYSLQLHVRDIAQPENLTFLERLRALSDSYEGRVLLGELHESEGEALHRAYTARGRLQLAYGYWLLGAERIGADTIIDTARALGHALDDGWPCWALDNHDFTRSTSRLGHKGPSLALTAALACLRGAMCLYQGAELGLPQADIPFDRILDPYGREFYPAYHGRDGSRTPIPWDDAQPHCGFSAVEPWLPITQPHRALSVAKQEHVPGSTLNRMRQFLNWRRGVHALREGSMTFCDSQGPVLAFYRASENERMLCAFNLGDTEAELVLPDDQLGTPMTGHGFTALRKKGAVVLPPDEAYFGALS
jgi:alpha-glucosidase